MPQIIAAVGAAMTAVAVGIGKALTAFGVSAYTAGVIGGLAVKYGVQIAIVWATSKLLAPKLDNVGARQADVLELSLGEHPREAIFGRAATGGTLIDAFNWGGSQNDWEAMVIALADHECHALVGFYVDDKYVAHVGNGNVSGYSDSNGAALQVFFLPGTMTQTLPGTVGAGPNALSFVSASGGRWTADDRLLGVAAVIVCYRFTPEILGGRPSFRWVVDGKKCYDPRKDSTVTGGSGSHRWNDPTTHEWTENAALCRYNYLRGVYTNGQLILGPGRTAEEAPPEDVIAAANLCDENVTLKAGGTVKRYTVSAVVRADEPWIDVEEAFAAAMGAELIERSGMIVIDPGAAKTVAKTFTDADLLEDFPVEVQGKLSRRDLVNTVTATYVDPAQMYEEQTAPIRRLLADITADGETRDRALALRFVTSANQAQRLGEIERRKARLQRTANVCLGPRYSVLEVGDWVTWQGSIYNALADRTYMVISAAVDDAQRITLGLREIASSVYSWTPASDELDVNVPSFVAPTPPDGWSTGSNNVLWSDIFGTGRPADNATVNRVFAQASAPAGAVDGDVWHDTAANPQITYYRVGGVWVTGPNLATNTNQLTDGAQLGSTAIWAQVSGTGRPADNATVGARTGVNLRNTADTVTLGDGDVITAQGTAADFAGRQWGATATADEARNVNRGNSDNVIPDPEFRDRQFWNFPATFVGADSDGGWSQRRIIRITASGNFDVYSGYFAVEPGETYIIRVRIWNNTGGWSGAFWPLIHMPWVAWYSLKHGGGVDPSVADASHAIVAAGDTLDLTWRHRNPTGVAGNANREWQFRFKGSGIPAGQTIAIAVSITRASRLGGLVFREDGTTVLTDAAAVTSLGTAADFVGRGPWATTSTPIATVLAPGANLFPYPRPLAGSTANALGWRGGISAGEWAWGRKYITQRLSGGAAFLDYYGYTVAIGGVAGTAFTFSVVGYASGPPFTWVLRFLRSDGSQTGGLTYATLDAASGRMRATATGPGDATQIDIFAEVNWPASGAYQDFVFWDVKLEAGAQMTPFVSSRLNPRQDGADITASNTAADFAGRGALATANTAAWGSQISGRPTELTDGRVAAGLDPSGDIARNLTESRLNSSNVLRRSSGGLYTGDLAATVGARAGTNLFRTDGSTVMTQAEVRTAEGTAADFAGRQWGATATEGQASNAQVPIGVNAAPNSEFLAGSSYPPLGWTGGGPGTTGGSLAGAIVTGGPRRAVRARVTGALAAGAYFDAAYGTYLDPAALRRYWLPVSPGDKVGASALVAIDDGLALATVAIYWKNANGAYIGESHSANITGATNGDSGNPADYQLGVVANVAPAGAAFASVFVRGIIRVGGASTGTVWFMSPLIVRLQPSAALTAAAVPPYHPTPIDRLSDRTAENVAADFAGRGALATANTAAWGSQISGRPTELTDGRVAAGLDASGDVARNLTESRLNSSNVLRRSSGGLYTGDLAATVGARAGVNLRNFADTVTLTDGDVITAQGTAADFAGRQWGATATEGQARNISRANTDDVIPDPEFRDRDFWGFPASFSGIDAGAGWTQRRIMQITQAGDYDVSSNYFAVEPGETYVIRARIWNNVGGWAGAFWPLLHIPYVAWFSLRHGYAVDPSAANASNAIVAAGDTFDLVWTVRNPTGIFENVNRQWQFYFKGRGIPAGQTIFVAMSITRAARLGRLVVREDGTTVLSDAAAVTALGTAADFVGRGPWATTSTPLATVLAPQPNLFPFPSPIYGVYGGSTPAPSSYGWQGAAIGVGYWQAAGGPIYYRSRGAGAPAADEYHIFDVPNAIAGQPYTVSLNGYMSGGNFYPYAECLDGSKTILSGHTLTYDGTSQRYRVTFTAPANTAFIRLVVLASYPAATGYQDVVFSRIKVEHGSQMTPFNSAPEVTPRQSGADVTGSNTAADFSGRGALATANYYRQASDPGAVTDGSLWTDTSVTPNILKQRISGVWQTLATANTVAAQLYATVSPKARVKTRSGTGSATTDTVTVTASGGSGGYTYAWTQQAGSSATATAATSATTAFQYTLVGLGEENVTTWECVVTDSAGAKASALVRAVFVETS